uniref:dTDP-glucose 4,6-dehydratase n=1 Tax=Eubacterium cellulosolvens TaxID=29322 RepID=UPI000481F69B|nr:dTDP-glucose 4,6-dehydratase [[Eubacterium] cellulosolvens]
MNIIVTGGAGFIGSNFVFYELKAHPEDRIICVDSLTYAGNLSTLDPVMNHPNFRFVKLDICDREGVYKLFEEEKPDIVANFAAESHVDRSIENPTVFLNTNIIGTSVLMDACRKYGIKRYHQVSTDEVYGDLPLDRPDLFFHEDTPIHTSSPYSTSKASADLLVNAYHRTYGLPVSISRCSNNYGPYQFPEKLIPLMIANALADKPLPVYGEGLNVRDWLYVEDHCKAIDLIMRQGTVGEVYNIGGHNEMKNIDIVKLICDYLDKPYSLIEHVTDRKGHDRRYAIDPTKIHGELGWLPETMFKDGIKMTIQWYLDNKSWWENIISGEYQNYYKEMYGKKKVLD